MTIEVIFIHNIHALRFFPRCFRLQSSKAEFDHSSLQWSSTVSSLTSLNFVWLEWPEELWVIERYRRIDKTGIIFFSRCYDDGHYVILFANLRFLLVRWISFRQLGGYYPGYTTGASTRCDFQKILEWHKMLWNLRWIAALTSCV